MQTRKLSLADRLLGEIDKAIKVLSTPAWASRALPSDPTGPAEAVVLAERERRTSARLMRVNHAGEVAAQALYRGQAFTARQSAVAASLRKAAAEEVDHLAWCEQRIGELDGHTSRLNPLWYSASFAIGAAAGAVGDRVSLGFIGETEKQVESHLREHMSRLPPADGRSRAILEQMSHDEIKHGAAAVAMGGRSLPVPVRMAMRMTARVMTHVSYWL